MSYPDTTCLGLAYKQGWCIHWVNGAAYMAVPDRLCLGWGDLELDVLSIPVASLAGLSLNSLNPS